MSPDIVTASREAWTLATIEYSAAQIRSSHVLIAILSNEAMSWNLQKVSGEFDKINVLTLQKSLAEICMDTGEDREAVGMGAVTAPGAKPSGTQARALKHQPSINSPSI